MRTDHPRRRVLPQGPFHPVWRRPPCRDTKCARGRPPHRFTDSPIHYMHNTTCTCQHVHAHVTCTCYMCMYKPPRHQIVTRLTTTADVEAACPPGARPPADEPSAKRSSASLATAASTHFGPSGAASSSTTSAAQQHAVPAAASSDDAPFMLGASPAQLGVNRRILVVGEGDFSLSQALVVSAHADVSNLTATTIRTASQTRLWFPSATPRIVDLVTRGATVLHGVSAAALREADGIRDNYDVIVFTFPFADRRRLSNTRPTQVSSRHSCGLPRPSFGTKARSQ
jgi:hypothetical protein